MLQLTNTLSRGWTGQTPSRLGEMNSGWSLVPKNRCLKDLFSCELILFINCIIELDLIIRLRFVLAWPLMTMCWTFKRWATARENRHRVCWFLNIQGSESTQFVRGFCCSGLVVLLKYLRSDQMQATSTPLGSKLLFEYILFEWI